VSILTRIFSREYSLEIVIALNKISRERYRLERDLFYTIVRYHTSQEGTRSLVRDIVIALKEMSRERFRLEQDLFISLERDLLSDIHILTPARAVSGDIVWPDSERRERGES
jgi:hypothetical protein